MKTITLTTEQLNTLNRGESITIEPAKPGLKFPVYAKSNLSGLVVRFDSKSSGTVVVGNPVHDEGYYLTIRGSVQDKETWTILEDYKETWEPKGVPLGSKYFYPLANGDTSRINNDGDNIDSSIRDSGAMCAEEWQAEELAKRNCINNLISQYVFEHLEEGEERNYCVVIPETSEQSAFAVSSTARCQVLMPFRIAKMLVKDIRSGVVKLDKKEKQR